MRMDAKQDLTAADVVNGYDEAELGERDRALRRGALRAPHRARDRGGPPARTRRASSPRSCATRFPRATRRRGPHPARRTFQAIRMEVNRELPNLADGLDESVHLLGPGGRVLVLAYHSLEDRIVKQTFARWAGEDEESAPPAKLPVEPARRRALARPLTRRPRRPTPAEIAANPRAESARLRAAERCDRTAMTAIPHSMHSAAPTIRAGSEREQRAQARHLRVRARSRAAAGACVWPCGCPRLADGDRAVRPRLVPRPRGAARVRDRSTDRAEAHRGAAVRALAGRGRDAFVAARDRRCRQAHRHASAADGRLHRRCRQPLRAHAAPDRTSSTLADVHGEAKKSLDP